MLQTKRLLACAAAFAATALMAHAPARAQDGADFYKGKTITIVVGIEQGTGFDLCFDMNKQILIGASADRPAPEGWSCDIWIGASRNPMTIDSGA